MERRRRGRRDGDLALDGAGIGSRIGELALRWALELNGVRGLELDGARIGVGVGILARTLREVLALNRDLHLVLTGRLITVHRERNLGGGGVVRQRSGGRNETVAHKGDARVRGRNALVDDAQRIQKLVAGRTGDYAPADCLLDREDLNVVVERGEQKVGSDLGAFSRSHQTFVARFRRGTSTVAALSIDPVQRTQHTGSADRSTSQPFTKSKRNHHGVVLNIININAIGLFVSQKTDSDLSLEYAQIQYVIHATPPI